MTRCEASQGESVALEREDFAGVGHAAGDGGGGDHERAHEKRPAGGTALAALEVAVGGAGAELIAHEFVRVHGETHRAARLAPFKACVAEHLVHAELLAKQPYAL